MGRRTGKAGLFDWVCGDAAVDNAQHPAQDGRAAREQKAQRIRYAQHPLAHRLLGKHLIDQQSRTLGHAPDAAAGTKTALLTAAGDQVLGMATVAAHAQEAML